MTLTKQAEAIAVEVINKKLEGCTFSQLANVCKVLSISVEDLANAERSFNRRKAPVTWADL